MGTKSGAIAKAQAKAFDDIHAGRLLFLVAHAAPPRSSSQGRFCRVRRSHHINGTSIIGYPSAHITTLLHLEPMGLPVVHVWCSTRWSLMEHALQGAALAETSSSHTR